MTKLEHDEEAAEKFGFKFVVSELVPKDEIWICDPMLAFKLGSLTHARSRPEPELGGYRFEKQGELLWMYSPEGDGFAMNAEMLAKIFKEYM